MPLARRATTAIAIGLILLASGLIAFTLSVPLLDKWEGLVSHLTKPSEPPPSTLDDQIATRALNAFQSISSVNGENRLWIQFVEDWFPVPLDSLEDRQYNFAQIADSRPPFSPSWFLPDAKISENYGEFLGSLQHDDRVRNELSASTDKVVADFFRKYGKTLRIGRRLHSQQYLPLAQSKDASLFRDSLVALDSARKLARARLSRVSDLQLAGRAYYDFVDSDTTMQYQGNSVTIKPFKLTPDLEKWIREPAKNLEEVGTGSAELRTSLEEDQGTTTGGSNQADSLKRPPSVIVRANLYARKFQVFAISRKPWFHQELLELYRHNPALGNQLSRFYGRDGLLGLIPVAVVILQEPTYVITMSREDFQQTQDSVSNGKRLFLTIGSSRIVIEGAQVKADPASFSWKIVPATPNKIQLVAVISEVF